MRGSNFDASTSLLTATLPAHNAELVGDSLTTLALNFEWRKIIAIALQYWFSHGRDALAMTNEDYFEALIQDLYTAEVLGMASNVVFAALGANQSTGSASYVAVPGFAASHTFTKANAKITIHNIRGSVNAGSTRGSVRGTLSSGVRQTSDSIGYINSNVRDLTWSGIFTGITPNAMHTIGLEFQETGTGSIILPAADNMVIEIEEYD